MRLSTSGSLVRPDGFEHDRAAADLEQPGAAGVLRRLDLAEQRNAVAAGENLERHRQDAVLGVPIELEFGVIDGDAAFVAVRLAERAGVGDDAAGQSFAAARPARSRR